MAKPVKVNRIAQTAQNLAPNNSSAQFACTHLRSRQARYLATTASVCNASTSGARTRLTDAHTVVANSSQS